MTATTRTGSNRRRTGSIGVTAAGVLMLGVAIFSLYSFLAFEDGARKHLIVASIAVYLFIECRLYLNRTDAFGLLAPPFLASIAHFFLAYLLPTSATFVDPWIQSRFVVYFQSFHEQIERALLYAWLAAFCMWRGYYLGLGAAARLRSVVRRSDIFRRELEPNVAAAVATQAAYFVLVAYAVSLGIFGFSSNVETRAANVELLDLINLGLAAGSLSFLLLLCYLFRRRQAGASATLLYAACVGLLILHVIVGAISGFKSQMVMPFVMVAAAKFLVTRRISFGAVALGGLALIAAYQVVEPYRAYLSRNGLSGVSDVSSLFDALQTSYAERDLGQQSSVPLSTQMLQRVDMTVMSAVGIQFADGSTDEAGRKGKEFAQSIYLAPVLAFVPRAFWADKPAFTSGGWFNRTVLRNNTEAAVGMGPIAWLYVLGGVVAVVIGFLCIGFAQALMFEGFARAGAGGVIVFLSAANSLVTLPSDLGPVFVGVLRLLPFAILAQWLLLKPSARR